MKTILRNLFCGWTCFWLAFHPAITLADAPDPAPLQQGQSAPFSGVLIPTLKAAEMTVKLEQADKTRRYHTMKIHYHNLQNQIRENQIKHFEAEIEDIKKYGDDNEH